MEAATYPNGEPIRSGDTVQTHGLARYLVLEVRQSVLMVSNDLNQIAPLDVAVVARKVTL